MTLFETLIHHGQEHLVAHYKSLMASPLEADHQLAKQFLCQLEDIDFPLMARLYKDLVEGNKDSDLEGHPPSRDLSPLEPDTIRPQDIDRLTQLGLTAISRGEVAVLLLAGGQGSRLGHEGPKGTYDIGLPGAPSLFELQTQSLLRVTEAAKAPIPWYIMTSDTNHEETLLAFQNNNYFGYKSGDITFFSQGMMPAVDFAGKLILGDRGQLALSPDGNGGCFIAMKRHGILDKLKAGGVKWLFLYGVDNAIVNIADPLFIGYTLESGKPAASKIVKKASPEEKVGVLCYDHGRPSIVEYSEMTEADTRATNPEGQLLYGNGNILNHLLSLDALSAYMDQPLTFHLATKKIPHLSGDRVETPRVPNGYKYESFIFDLFPHFEDMAALSVVRELEFAPVKNATGEDSPETARILYANKFGIDL